MYLHWNPNIYHADKLLNNIVAVMVIKTHSVVVSLVPWSKIEQYDVMIGKYLNCDRSALILVPVCVVGSQIEAYYTKTFPIKRQ